jgi:hypothetical protein
MRYQTSHEERPSERPGKQSVRGGWGFRKNHPNDFGDFALRFAGIAISL